MTFTILGLDHVVLRASDMAGLERFYCDVLGCTVERREEDFGLVQLRAGRTLVDLLDVARPAGRAGGPPPGKDRHNMDHFCLRIEPFDWPALRAYFAARGIPASEVLQRYGADGEGPSIYITDPAGNSVELKGPPSA
jgi:catechol 2,3-dioxygenase-like lactoylglutathione lyase family enzyme